MAYPARHRDNGRETPIPGGSENGVGSAARRRIELTNLDAVEFVQSKSPAWLAKTLVYLDPPYYEKGSQLYYDYYGDKDHLEVAQVVRSLSKVRWLVSYDDVLPIQEMYAGTPALQYTIGYSARNGFAVVKPCSSATV